MGLEIERRALRRVARSRIVEGFVGHCLCWG
jgi:hypothetical protein